VLLRNEDVPKREPLFNIAWRKGVRELGVSKIYDSKLFVFAMVKDELTKKRKT